MLSLRNGLGSVTMVHCPSWRNPPRVYLRDNVVDVDLSTTEADLSQRLWFLFAFIETGAGVLAPYRIACGLLSELRFAGDILTRLLWASCEEFASSRLD